MTLLLTIIAFLIIFSVLILVHEAGHYFAAKKMGVKVEEFGFGLPPRIWGVKKKKNGTLFSINAIPFGGFVRLFGEDKVSSKSLKSQNSFVSKSPWKKIVIVVAGVFMNFLLAYILLSFGLIIGMQPLITNTQQIYDGINSGNIQVESGLVVKTVESSGQNLFQAHDRLLAINNQKIILGDEFSKLIDAKKYKITVLRNGALQNITAKYSKNSPWFILDDSIFLPKPTIYDIDQNSIYAKAGLEKGDVIVSVNGEQIFDFDKLNQILQNDSNLKIKVLRNNVDLNFKITQNRIAQIVISEVLPNSPAIKAGLKKGDEVLAINSQNIYSINDLKKMLATKGTGENKYKIIRSGKVMDISIQPNSNGLVGIILAQLDKSDHSGLSFYLKTVPYSVLKMKNIQYPWYEAFGNAFKEMYTLSVVTVQMFGGVIQSIVTRFQVPAGVVGPVGIAQLTYTFVQQGIMSLIRFTALLSLSLAIINILPFPGLDGGRLLLIFVSMLIGRKINPRLEGIINITGFLLLLLLIFLITFNDIARLFGVG